MNALFMDPLKEIWFVMGEYLPPSYGIIQLAAYLERELENVESNLILDCNAGQIFWEELENQISSFYPDIVFFETL